MLGAGFGALTEHFAVPIGVHLVGVGLAAMVTTRIAVRFLQPAEHVVADEPDEPQSAALDPWPIRSPTRRPRTAGAPGWPCGGIRGSC